MSIGATLVPVNQNSRRTLTILYGKIIRTLEKLPMSYSYRQHTEKLVQDRAKIVSNTENIHTIEEIIGHGRIDELVLQAEQELKLAKKFLQWKSWESAMNKNPTPHWAWPPHK